MTAFNNIWCAESYMDPVTRKPQYRLLLKDGTRIQVSKNEFSVAKRMLEELYPEQQSNNLPRLPVKPTIETSNDKQHKGFKSWVTTLTKWLKSVSGKYL